MGYKYHELEPMFHKPTADLFIDDKGIEVSKGASQPKFKGIVAGAFDLIHPGYVRMSKSVSSTQSSYNFPRRSFDGKTQ